MQADPRLRRVCTLVALTAPNLLVVFDGMAVAVALPTMAAEVGLVGASAHWPITVHSVALGGMLLAGGRWGDRRSRRRPLELGLVLVAVGAAVAAASFDAVGLLFGRSVQGIGAALAIPSAFAMISRISPTVRRHRLFAAAAVAGGLGVLGGSYVGGLVTTGPGWRWAVLLVAPVAALAAAAVSQLPSTDVTAPPAGPGVDAVFGLLTAVTVGLLILGSTTLAVGVPTAWPALAATGVAGLAVLAVVVRRRREGRPLIARALQRDRVFRTCLVGVVGQEYAYQTAVLAGVLMVQDLFSYSAGDAGAAFLPLGVAVLLGSPLARMLLRQAAWHRVVTAAQMCGAVGLGLLACGTSAAAAPVWIVAGLSLVGASNTVSAVTLNAMVGRHVPAQLTGAAYGLYETTKYLASGLAAAAVTFLLTAGGRSATGYATTLLLGAAAAALTAAVSLRVAGAFSSAKQLAVPSGR